MTAAGASSRSSRWVLLSLLLVISTAAASVIAYSRLRERTAVEDKASNWLPDQSAMSFEPWWQEEAVLSAYLPIVSTIGKNHVKSCAALSWSESRDYDHVYLVACRGRTDTSHYLIVRTDTQRVYTVGLHWLKERPLCAPTMIGKCAPSTP